MDLLIAKDVYEKYAHKIGVHPKSELDRDIDSLFINPNNRFLLSKNLVESIEDSIRGNSKAESFMQPFLAHLIQNQSLNISSGAIKGDDLATMTSMYNNYLVKPSNDKRDVFLNIAFQEKNSLKKEASIIIEKNDKPNFHWLWLSLACHHPKPICLRYYDFKSNKEIETLFSDAISGVQKKPFVDIFDRQVNLSHTLFNAIKNTFVNYYTSMKYAEQNEKKAAIKRCFGKVNIYNSTTNNVHERRIMLSCLIIEADDDFWNLTYKRTTWKIDITYCAKTTTSIGTKKCNFRMLN